MWLNERRRGPGWSASSPPASSAASSSSSFPNGAAAATPAPATPAGKMPLLGPPQGPGPRRRAARVSGVSGSRLPAGGARISCRGSRAPGAAPLDRTIRARGRGRRQRRAFEVLGAPARSPRRGATLVAPGLREGGCAAATPAGRAPRRPQQLRQRQEQGRSIFWVRARWTFPPSLLIFSSCYCDLMAL